MIDELEQEKESPLTAKETLEFAREMVGHLAESPFDCVVSASDMPRQNGIECPEAVRTEYPDLPFTLHTGKRVVQSETVIGHDAGRELVTTACTTDPHV